MNAVELYKKLPKSNCGECPQKACMPFAVSLMQGGTELSECPRLTDAERDELKGSLVQSDWREELILKLREEVRGIRLSEIAGGIGAELRGDALFLKCLGREFTISPDGEVGTRGHITPWIKILLLHYIRTAGTGDLTGKWVSYRDLKNGMVKYASFLRECEEPLKELFRKDAGKTEAMLVRFGAERRSGYPSEYAWFLSLLPKVPVVILYWPAEEEFPSKTIILFDSTADRFLDVESLIFLVEGFVKNLEKAIYS